MNTKNGIILAVLISVSIVITLVVLYNMRTNELFSDKTYFIWLDYFKQVYGSDSYSLNIGELLQIPPNSDSINFLYYECMPKELKDLIVVKPLEKQSVLPKFGQWWIPVWFPTGCVALNMYEPSNPLQYPLISGIPDYEIAEFVHTNDTLQELNTTLEEHYVHQQKLKHFIC
jgi:hypothetical protein